MKTAVRWMRVALSSKAGQTDDGLWVTESRNPHHIGKGEVMRKAFSTILWVLALAGVSGVALIVLPLIPRL